MRTNWHRMACLFFIASLLASAFPGLAQAQKEKVDLNKAEALELQSLPGIGPALAQRIIEHRQKNGPFKRPEDLMNVPGIGQKKFETLKDKITVGTVSENKPGKSSGPGL